jgi:DNA-directed RNA polymerase specialized sigma24 family protein
MTETSAEKLRGAGEFPATHWSVVLHAAQAGSAKADAALARLCESYWYPLYVFLRRQGYQPEEAEDLTQTFFGRLVHKEILAGLTEEGGKFRSFLLMALKRFLANEWHREHAQKRGGGKLMISADATAEQRYQGALVDRATPETLFARKWAFAVLDRVWSRLRDEYAAIGKPTLFEQLQGCLPGADRELSCVDAAAALAMNEGTVRMAALRLRRRYGEMLRAEIAATVSRPEEIDGEIRHLIEVAGR